MRPKPSDNTWTDFALNRLKAVCWEEAGVHDTDADLPNIIHEWKRNVQIIAEILEVESVNPFTFDFAEAYCPEVAVSPTVDDWLNAVKDRVNPDRGRSYVLKLLRATLHWYALIDAEKEVSQTRMDEVYEPILRFFEVGGGIYVEHVIFYELYPTACTLIQPRVGTAHRAKKESQS